MKRHPIHLLPLLLALLFVSAACGNNEPEPIPVTPVAINYMSFEQSTQILAEELVIQRFQEKHPAIQIIRTSYGQQPQEYLLGGGDVPDVMFLWTGYLLDTAMRQELLGNLSDVWEENGFDESIAPAIQSMSRSQGAPYFVPGGHGWTALYYNRAIFESYGLTPPTTWQEFLAICETLLAYGETPLSLPGNNAFVTTLWFDYLNMRLNGPDYHRRLLNGEERYTDPEVAAVFETLRELLAKGYFVENPTGMSDLNSLLALVRADADAPIAGQKAVMTLASNFTLGELPAPLRDELDFFAFPAMNPDQPVGEVGITFGFVVPAAAPNPGQANTFAGFLGSSESVQALTEQTPAQLIWAPARTDIDRARYSEEILQASGMVQGADAFGPPMFLSLPSSMENTLNQVFTRLLRSQGEPADWQLLLEDARQRAIQNGEYAGQ